MYSMVMMMTMAAAPDAAAFGGHRSGGGCGGYVSSYGCCGGYSSCYGSGYSSSYGCCGGYSSCHGHSRSGFLGGLMMGRGHHRSHGCCGGSVSYGCCGGYSSCYGSSYSSCYGSSYSSCYGSSCYGSSYPTYGAGCVGGGMMAPPYSAPVAPMTPPVTPPMVDPIKEKTSAPARIVVRVPADATLTFDGVRTSATATRREFTTPELQAGVAYQYTVVAEVVVAGRAASQSFRVAVKAGETTEVDMTNVAVTALASR